MLLNNGSAIFDRLNTPILAWHSLLQAWQMNLECRMEVRHGSLGLFAVFRSLLISNRWFRLFPAFVSPLWTAWCQPLRSSDSCSHLPESIPLRFSPPPPRKCNWNVVWSGLPGGVTWPANHTSCILLYGCYSYDVRYPAIEDDVCKDEASIKLGRMKLNTKSE